LLLLLQKKNTIIIKNSIPIDGKDSCSFDMPDITIMSSKPNYTVASDIPIIIRAELIQQLPKTGKKTKSRTFKKILFSVSTKKSASKVTEY